MNRYAGQDKTVVTPVGDALRRSSGCPVFLSVVVPAYDEAGNVRPLYRALVESLRTSNYDWELIIVDDGSPDGTTWSEIILLNDEDQRVKGIRFSRNFGHQYALLAGLRRAAGQVVVTMDADLQYPPRVIPEMVKAWSRGSKIVHTVRSDSKRTTWFKRITSRAFYRVFSMLSGVKLSPGMADFRLLDREVVNQLLRFRESNLFLRGLVQWVGYPSARVSFRAEERFSGKTKYSLVKMIGLAKDGLTGFSTIPLRLASYLGFLTSGLAFLELFYVLAVRLFTGRAVAGWASLAGVISLLFGILFILIGFLGEYMSKILEQVRDRPRYITSDELGFSVHSLGSTGDHAAEDQAPALRTQVTL